jgi:hypothetical protein
MKANEAIAIRWPHRLPPELSERGTCASGRFPPDWWFPGVGETDRAERAQRLCRSCPALAACRAYVDAAPGELHGVWAATTHSERKRDRLARRRQGAA